MYDERMLCLSAACGPAVHVLASSSSTDSVACSQDSNRLTEGFECGTPTYSYFPFGKDGAIRGMTWIPRSRKISALDSSGEFIHIHPVATENQREGKTHMLNFKPIHNGSLSSGEVHGACFAFPQRSSRYIAVGKSDGVIDLYDFRKKLTLRSQFCCVTTSDRINMRDDEFPKPTCITWALNDTLLVVGNRTGSLCVFLAASPESEMKELTSPSGYEKTSCRVVQTAQMDTRIVAAGYSSGSVVVWRMDWPLSDSAHEHILAYFSLPSFTRTQNSLVQDTLSLAFSPVNPRLLGTAGLPDLRLRLWFVEPSGSSHNAPIETLVPVEPSLGYVSVAMAPDKFTLATGLMDGQVWLYDMRNLSAPTRRIRLKGFPVSMLSFTSVSCSVDEVRLQDTIGSQTEVTKENSSTSLADSLNPNCSPKDDTLTNASFRIGSEYGSVLQEFTLSEASPNFDKTNDSPALPVETNKFTTPTFNSPDKSDLPVPSAHSVTNFDTDSFRTTVRPNSLAPSNSEFGQDPLLADSITTRLELLLGKYQDNLERRLDRSFGQLTLHISNLQNEVKRASREFGDAILCLRRENQALRSELEKRCAFY
ncbi:unnamed protein product [Calicophoron daubneyi]|uniref:Uncharacterized protein n=1 Tax=Calicophoron daubneyi TaxID=300641 RepID=A0AAV2T5Q8_CALDB